MKMELKKMDGEAIPNEREILHELNNELQVNHHREAINGIRYTLQPGLWGDWGNISEKPDRRKIKLKGKINSEISGGGRVLIFSEGRDF